MASLAFNALSLSPKTVALLPTRYKSQNYALTVQGLPLSSNTRFRLNTAPRANVVLSPKGRGFKTLWCTPASKNGDAVIESSAEEQHTEVVSAIPVVMEFYAAINKKDLKALSDIMLDKCLFHDLSFPKAFEGKEAVLQYTKDLMEAMANGMLFKIDGLTEGDDLSVAVLWHLEWQGHQIPFSKGYGIFYCEKQGDRLLVRSELLSTTDAARKMFIKDKSKTVASLFEQFPVTVKSIV